MCTMRTQTFVKQFVPLLENVLTWSGADTRPDKFVQLPFLAEAEAMIMCEVDPAEMMAWRDTRQQGARELLHWRSIHVLSNY